MYIVVDIGGTKTRVAGSRDLKDLTEPAVFETPQKYEAGIAAIAEAARSVARNDAIQGLAAGVPRLAHDNRTVLPPRPSSNIHDWDGKSVADDLERAIGTHAHLLNDAALVGLGEAHHGAGKGVSIMVYVTVSTGVNAVRLVDGKLEPTAANYSIGDQYITMSDPMISWEKIVSGRAIQEKYGTHPRELGKDHPLWKELALPVAIGVHNSILHWSPERVVLGGSMFNEIGIPVESVAEHVKSIMKSPSVPEIVHSALGDVGGLWGGLALLKQKI